ncbi:MAG: helix-turn-helix domain-containing protein [Victivallales bacterium]|nr:helix-turn-helix domain-containing protein [Victivallales bacterium]
MEIPHVISGGVYRSPQQSRQVIPCRWMCLNISGLLDAKDFFPDGTTMPIRSLEHPSVSLGYPGFVTNFHYGINRENWVILLDMPSLQFSTEEHMLYLDTGRERLPLKLRHLVSEAEIPALREQFRSITLLSRSALAADRLHADLIAAGLFHHFLPTPEPNTRAAQLKARLDADPTWRRSVLEHCHGLGQPDVLRESFRNQFLMTPYEYRDKQRKSLLLSLMTHSEESYKAIAAELGLKHVQHLNALVRKYFDCTPSQLRQQYHHELPFVESSKIK